MSEINEASIFNLTDPLKPGAANELLMQSLVHGDRTPQAEADEPARLISFGTTLSPCGLH